MVNNIINEVKSKERVGVGIGNLTLSTGTRLAGRKALVTGASKGIGREIALALAREGADVAINYRSSELEAEEVARWLEGMGIDTWIYPADVSSIDSVKEMKRCLTKYFGGIDILVNNAGINVDKLFVKMDEEMWNKVISVNLTGVFNCTNTFIDRIIESRCGRIINITSIVGQMGNIGQVNYAASKAGIIGMTKSLAREMARSHVTVNAIAPGFIETDMVKGIPDKVKERILAQVPLGRFGRPEEVARAVVYLASDDASYITGHVLNINGGMYL
ncbi:MAG: 3-oxoacyl-[acyl-carrier-protein] reductase [Thermoplasmata archaeon]|nr:MAG: 3-oxoacyl-[acyl-carrier-protein] reductase [Thermoplasmata archaeon]